MKKWIVFLILLMIACTTTNHNETQTDVSRLALIYKEVTSQEALDLLSQIDLLLDVRSQAEYDQKHIEGAMLLPVGSLESRINEFEDYKGKNILVYCKSGYRSKLASDMLIEKGFKRIFNMQDGIMGWEEAGFPLEE